VQTAASHVVTRAPTSCSRFSQSGWRSWPWKTRTTWPAARWCT